MDFSRGRRLSWWWVVGNSLVFLLASLLGDAVQADHHRGLDLKSFAVGVVVILVGNAIVAVMVVLAERRRVQRKKAAPTPARMPDAG
jgi:drug/metabolite transporter (DMT)-like permease